jgi:hypothetical protein
VLLRNIRAPTPPGFPRRPLVAVLHHGRRTRTRRRELHAAYADALTGPWRLHPQTPALVDQGGARPGGTPFVDATGALVLPVQDCRGTYGAAARFLRFSVLNAGDPLRPPRRPRDRRPAVAQARRRLPTPSPPAATSRFSTPSASPARSAATPSTSSASSAADSEVDSLIAHREHGEAEEGNLRLSAFDHRQTYQPRTA